MDMKDIKKIQIEAGPNQLAYDFDEEKGIFSVWLGAYVKNAPATAQFTEIGLDFTRWNIEQFNRPNELEG